MDTRRKFTDSKNDIIFDLRRKLTKLSRKTRFRTMASPGACGVFSTQHCSRTKHRSRILSFSFDLQSCLHKYKRLACRYVATRWRNLLSNLPKMRIWIGRNRTTDDVQPSIILQVSKRGEVFLYFTLLHVTYILPQKFARTHVPWLCSKVMSKSTKTLPAKIQRTVY